MDLLPDPLDAHRYGDGQCIALGPGTALSAGPGAGRAERWLRAELGAATGLPLLPPEAASGGSGGPAHAVRLAVHPLVTEELGPEGYQVMVSPNGADVFGGGPAGVFWGAQTLRQLLGPDAYRRAPLAGRSWHLPICRIQDAPRFARRGLLLDAARRFLPRRDVLRYLDLMAAHKLNVLRLRLHPDAVAAPAEGAPAGPGGARDGLSRGGPAHGGRYSRDDLREIAAYAAERQIAVVPGIGLPGAGPPGADGGGAPAGGPGCAAEALEEVREVFGHPAAPGGGSPPPGDGGSWPDGEGGAVPVRSAAAAAAAAAAGRDVVVCPEQARLDRPRSGARDAPGTADRVLTVADVYRLEPVPPELRADPEAARRVVGVRAELWNEAAGDARDLDRLLFPRLAAFAEVAWSQLPADPAERDLDGFGRRLAVHLARLDAMGVECLPPGGPHPWRHRPGEAGRPAV
ncbi:family 20 glycosylhydrolase [Streptomyces sp. NPDC001380]|uniref:family 20 glycosylhydrolase n=1 Tax=Streptomyces sp. NPDC001380 TaxID=3364566 RepID=UPI00369C7A3B